MTTVTLPPPADDVIEAEVIDEQRETVAYHGIVVAQHDGYSFIGSVKRRTETINTGGDVFVPQEFPVNTLVTFTELNDDKTRPGRFRTEHAFPLTESMVRVNGVRLPRDLVVRRMTERATYHATAKAVDPAEAIKAAENQPFAEMLIRAEETAGVPSQMLDEKIGEIIQDFVHERFAMLEDCGVDYSIKGGIDEQSEQAMMDEIVASYREHGLQGQVKSVTEQYTKFTDIRTIFTTLYAEKLLTPQSIIPIRYMSDMLVACPVWYVHGKSDLPNTANNDDPVPDHAVQFFSDAVGTQQFAWLYQMYNRRTRPLSAFSGRDIMPPKLIKILKTAKQIFDYVVIATPYHDVASKEWADPNWMRNIDPYLIGFVKDLPFMFLLGRWSGTGLFPLMADMIADTIDHIRTRKDGLKRFPNNAYWYKGKTNTIADCTYLGSGARDHALVEFANEVIAHFEAGDLFDWLRGDTQALGAGSTVPATT